MIEVQYGKCYKAQGLAYWITFRIDEDFNPQSIKFEDYYETGRKNMFGDDIDEIFFVDYVPDWYSNHQREWATSIRPNIDEFKKLITESLEAESPIDLPDNMQLYAFDFGDD